MARAAVAVVAVPKLHRRRSVVVPKVARQSGHVPLRGRVWPSRDVSSSPPRYGAPPEGNAEGGRMSQEPRRRARKWRPWASYLLNEFGDLFGILLGLAVALVVLALVVSYLWALVQDFRNDEPVGCSNWSPGKVAESPHDAACEAQWEDQLEGLTP